MTQRSVLVAGATGRQGGTVAEHLLSGNYGEFDVHALTRHPESTQAKALTEQGATIIEGNLLNEESLRPAVEAVDAVYCVTTFGDGNFKAEVEQGITLAEVAADAGVDHFVFSSVAGANRDTGLRHVETKTEIEHRIRKLDLPATVLRPRFFMQNFERQREAILDGILELPMTQGASRQMLDLEDVGRVVSIVLQSPEEYVGETIELAGDEHTVESAAEVLTAVTGIEVEPQYVPVEAARDGLIEANGEAVGNDLANMFEWHNSHDLDTSIESIDRDYGFDLTRFESYLRKNDWSQ